MTYTFCAQPTAQYGQTDLTTRSASAVRAWCVSEPLDLTAAPRPIGSGPRNWRSTGHRDGRGSSAIVPRQLGRRAAPDPVDHDRVAGGVVLAGIDQSLGAVGKLGPTEAFAGMQIVAEVGRHAGGEHVRQPGSDPELTSARLV